MIFRQLFDARSSTFTYLLGDETSRQAVLIDSVFEQVRRDAALIEELELKLVAAVETHVHADHVTAAWLLRERFGCDICLGASSGASGAQRYLEDGDEIAFGRRSLRAISTPGHTAGCTSFLLDDESMVFTGDCLLIRGCGRTDFQGGSSKELFVSVRERLFALPESCQVFPAHDYSGRTSTTIGEEKRFNPRLGGDRSVNDFVGSMSNLGLPHPKQIDVAVPANLECGKPTAERPASEEPSWAPLRYTFAGVWEIEPHVLEEMLTEVQVVDVREADEYAGVLGHIRGSMLIPLGELSDRAGELEGGRPIVAVCRSGGRSAQACVMLRKAGFEQAANLAGGMIRWRSQGLPVES